MGKITLILGGARSGKSTQALNLAKGSKGVAFIATGEGLDQEMEERILEHKAARPDNWKTFEEPKELAGLLAKLDGPFDCIIIDCLTLLVSNLLLSGCKDQLIADKIKASLLQLRKRKAKAIIVSNEVGLGIVPANKLARRFRDIAGKINRIVAQESDEVLFIASGIPLTLKQSRPGEE
ncbi:MAG: bifunctional adenosylcobinamide kinase/adenosylcobinamide-phosphate guanylyltransferase [Candidatus Omnitrophota bacterium]